MLKVSPCLAKLDSLYARRILREFATDAKR